VPALSDWQGPAWRGNRICLEIGQADSESVTVGLGVLSVLTSMVKSLSLATQRPRRPGNCDHGVRYGPDSPCHRGSETAGPATVTPRRPGAAVRSGCPRVLQFCAATTRFVQSTTERWARTRGANIANLLRRAGIRASGSLLFMAMRCCGEIGCQRFDASSGLTCNFDCLGPAGIFSVAQLKPD
jgi:hypothetical protein